MPTSYVVLSLTTLRLLKVTHVSFKCDTPFIWDDIAQRSFEQLKALLVSAPLLHPPNYHCDYLLYLDAPYSTIGKVLIQDDDDGFEHAIYYLSRNHLDTKTRYTYVEKLTLVAIQVV